MDENLTSVNAEQVSDEGSQIEQVNSESVNTEAATVQNEKPVQSAEENSKYAAIRREAEQKAKAETTKAIDAEYDRLYGAEYGIHTKADYDAAIAKQQAETERQKFQQENGIDPEALKPLFQQWKESDPDLQELKAMRAEKKASQDLVDLNNELKETGIDLQIKDLSTDELKKLPNIDGMIDYVKKGHSLADAFFLANKKDIMSKQVQAAQQDTIKKITANGASSPGSLSAGGEVDFISAETFEANKNDRQWIIKNLTKITKSRAKW